MRTTFTKRLGTLTGALVLSLGLAAPAAAQEHKVVVTHSSNSFAFLTYFAASAMNYFEEAGVQVEEVRTGSGSKSLAAMAGGDADVYVGATASAFKSREQGLPVKIFAPVVTQQTSSIVVSRQWAEKMNVTEDSPLEEKMQALRGARIAMSGAGSGSDQAVRYVMAEAGLNPDRDAQLVSMGVNPAAYMGAMEADQIDGFCISPPETKLAEREIGAVMLINMAVGEVPSLDGFFYIGLQARDEWLASNPETAARMAVALKMAMDAVHDPARSAQVGEAVHAKYYPEMDTDLFTAAWNDQIASVPTTLDMTDEMVRQVVDFHNTFAEDKIDESLIPDVVTRDVVEAAKALMSN